MKCTTYKQIERAVALACLLPFFTNCAFAITIAPPENHEDLTNFDCSESNAPAVLDTLFAGLQGVRVLVASEADDSAYTNSPISRDADLVLGVGLGVLAVSSAMYGFSAVSQCGRAKQALSIREHAQRNNGGANSTVPAGCTADVDCKGNRTCQAGMCVDP